jgi:hypothetical protein
MVVIPENKPVIENLNTYYLDIYKLLEHFQGEIGAGGVSFKSHAAAGVIFFDQHSILGGFFEDKNDTSSGADAVERLIQSGDRYNYQVAVYELAPEEVYFWASLPTAEIIYADLSTEFTDLEGLIHKMISERLTGFIDVAIGSGEERGMIFLLNGRLQGGLSFRRNEKTDLSVANQKKIVQLTKKHGGVFNVCRIPLSEMRREERALAEAGDAPAESVLPMLEAFLQISENALGDKKKSGKDFNKMLKQKFVAKADRWAFLDPFAGEFEYLNREIYFSGDASDRELAAGVIFSVQELARELGQQPKWLAKLEAWLDRNAEQLERLGIRLV